MKVIGQCLNLMFSFSRQRQTIEPLHTYVFSNIKRQYYGDLCDRMTESRDLLMVMYDFIRLFRGGHITLSDINTILQDVKNTYEILLSMFFSSIQFRFSSVFQPVIIQTIMIINRKSKCLNVSDITSFDKCLKHRTFKFVILFLSIEISRFSIPHYQLNYYLRHCTYNSNNNNKKIAAIIFHKNIRSSMIDKYLQ